MQVPKWRFVLEDRSNESTLHLSVIHLTFTFLMMSNFNTGDRQDLQAFLAEKKRKIQEKLAAAQSKINTNPDAATTTTSNNALTV